MARTDALVEQAATALAQINGFSRSERRTIITLVAEHALWSHAADTAYGAVLRQMGARDFEWPEFDGWHAVFTGRGAFPPLWDGLERRPAPGVSLPVQQVYRERKLRLLIDWLHGLVATRAEMRAALRRYTMRGFQAEITRQSADTLCPACDPLNHENIQSNSGDVPPFHPGCRCLILATPGLKVSGPADSSGMPRHAVSGTPSTTRSPSR